MAENETVSEIIDFPNVSMSLIAYWKPFRNDLGEKRTSASWRLQLYFPGPDARYNGALAELRPAPSHMKTYEEFNEDLEGALKQLITLDKQQFQGVYRKKIGNATRDKSTTLEIVAENGTSHLEVGAISRAGYHWYENLSTEDINRAIDVMKAVPTRAGILMKTLEALT